MPDYVDYTTVPHLAGVELATAGMEWPASTGPVTFTLEHLADAVVAANEDPHIRVPRLKLGHRSEVNGELLTIDPFRDLGDAAPAFGKVTNLRTENDGAVLIGDFIEVPEWLATAMPSAYPNRSGDWYMDVETEGGKRYLLVLAAMSLLGTALPAVTDLEDLERFIEGGPDALETTTRRGNVPAAQETSVSVDRIRRAFNFEWATSDPVEGLDTYWWWARDVRVDPEEVIADDDEGNLWRVPFSTDGEEEVTFAEPERVRVVYVPVATSSGDVDLRRSAPVRSGQRVLATALDRPEKQRQGANRPETEREEASVPPTVTPEQLERLRQLPEDADQTQIDAALETPGDPPADPPEGDPAPATDPPTPGEEPEEEPAEPAAATDGGVRGALGLPSTATDQQVRDRVRELEANAAAGAAVATERTREQRDALVEAAVEDGRIPPSARQAWRDALDARPEAETAALAALTPGRVPVTERGAADTADAAQTAGTGWFPHLTKQEA